jgi:citrate synthase
MVMFLGFGNRDNIKGDSRVPTITQALLHVAPAPDGEKWVQMYEILEKTMVSATGIKPNLDFPTGPAYFLMGFDVEMFTPIFVMSRITGWTAHIIEQGQSNALIRPLSQYSGVPQRTVVA